MKWNSWSAINAIPGLVSLLRLNIHIRDESNIGRLLYEDMNSVRGFKSPAGFVMEMFTLIYLSQNCNSLAFMD